MRNILVPSALALSLAATAAAVMITFAGPASAGPVCTTAPRAQWLTEAQMDPRFKIITAPEVVELLMGAKGSLQIA